MNSRALCLYNGWIFTVTAVLFGCNLAFAGEHPVQHLGPLPVGITLPVTLTKTLDGKHIGLGELIVVKLSQRVPVGIGHYLPEETEVIGSVVGYSDGLLSLQFTQIRLRHEIEPIRVKLVAAAGWNDVWNTRLPLGGTDRGLSSPADWTTMQIGRDEIYRGGWYGKVYNQYSEPVGKADFYGVYADPQSPGALRRAMGPFSTTSAGLYDVPGLAIVSVGGAGEPIVFRLQSPRWRLDTPDALLLEVVD